MNPVKVFAVNSSPRGDQSSTAKLLKSFMNGAREAGALTETEYIFNKNIKPCTGCYNCWTRTPGECVQQDDMKEMLDKIIECDILVYSTPLYIWSINGPMKTFMDRMLPLSNPFAEEKNGIVRKLGRDDVKYSKVVLVSTCGLPGVHNFDSLVHLFEAQCRFREKEFSGALLFSSSRAVKDTDRESVLAAAWEAGVQLVQKGKIGDEVLDRISRQYVATIDYVESSNKMFSELRRGK